MRTCKDFHITNASIGNSHTLYNALLLFKFQHAQIQRHWNTSLPSQAIIEDERHVLDECPLYEDLRMELQGGLLDKLREGADYGPLFEGKNTMLFGKLVKNIMKKRFPKNIT